ncbi:MAG: BsaA family SipW-dependent biofilm matrix protein [Clostridiales Family XIII bacterium]|jgi:predicted ribosomally synthesized peptide with SipW-like signal peptide|nr:BsaA family SipW-dependent biofilm matrix protein [Clostridiales Family XIII bacterium]
MSFIHLFNNKRRIGIVCSALLAAVIAVSGTFAWFTAKDSVINHLSTDMITDGSTSILEIFRPPTEWKPGQKVTKTVAVVNTGAGDVLVRASFEEVLQKLNGAPKPHDTPLDPAGTAVPQLFNDTAFASWGTPQALGLTPTPALPADVTLKVKRIPENPNPGDPVAFSFVAWHSIPTGAYQGKAQKVTADFEVDGATLKVANLKYWQYDGKTSTEAAWANFVDKKTGAAPTLPDNADIGFAKTDLAGKMIHMDFTDKASAIAAQPVKDKWWYNKADGFFYYIGKVESGMVTPNLLDSLTLDSAADVAYAGMDFDLIVNIEAIQNTKDAITSTSGGWNLTPYPQLLTIMSTFCE